MHTLYGTSACHLCELAQAMLDEMGVSYRHEDISESDALFERYGATIPVVKNSLGGELNWPFTPGELREFLSKPH